MTPEMTTLLTLLLVFVAAVAVSALVLKRYYKKVKTGHALIVVRSGERLEVRLTGGLVLPVIHVAEYIDLTQKNLNIEVKKGNVPVDDLHIEELVVTAGLRVGDAKEDILKAAKLSGAAVAGKRSRMEELFTKELRNLIAEEIKDKKKLEIEYSFEKLQREIIRTFNERKHGYLLESLVVEKIV